MKQYAYCSKVLNNSCFVGRHLHLDLCSGGTPWVVLVVEEMLHCQGRNQNSCIQDKCLNLYIISLVPSDIKETLLEKMMSQYVVKQTALHS